MFMQKLIDSLPLILLVSLVPYFFYSEPNIAQSVIVTAIAALSGYSYYLASLKKPDYVKIFTERLDNRDSQVTKAFTHLETTLNEVKDNQSKLNIVKTNDEKRRNTRW